MIHAANLAAGETIKATFSLSRVVCCCCRSLFFPPGFCFWTHLLGLNPPDCTWPWTVCHFPAFTPSVTMLLTLSLRYGPPPASPCPVAAPFWPPETAPLGDRDPTARQRIQKRDNNDRQKRRKKSTESEKVIYKLDGSLSIHMVSGVRQISRVCEEAGLDFQAKLNDGGWERSAIQCGKKEVVQKRR